MPLKISNSSFRPASKSAAHSSTLCFIFRIDFILQSFFHPFLLTIVFFSAVVLFYFVQSCFPPVLLFILFDLMIRVFLASFLSFSFLHSILPSSWIHYYFFLHLIPPFRLICSFLPLFIPSLPSLVFWMSGWKGEKNANYSDMYTSQRPGNEMKRICSDDVRYKAHFRRLFPFNARVYNDMQRRLLPSTTAGIARNPSTIFTYLVHP